MVGKLISIILFGVWFKLYNVIFYSFFDIPVDFVLGEGMNWFKVYWIVFFISSTLLLFKVMSVIYHLNNRRLEQTEP